MTVIDATGAPAKADMTVLVVEERIKPNSAIPKRARIGCNATGLVSLKNFPVPGADRRTELCMRRKTGRKIDPWGFLGGQNPTI